jgi:transposase-like protein
MEGESIKRQRFDRDFKLSTVKMVTEGGHKVSEVARSLGIHPNQIYNWKRKFSDNGEKAFPGNGHLTEISALRRKLRDVEMERDILKKAVGIFSKMTENGSGL